MAGEAGRFTDPLYSPGSDLISIYNTLIVDAIETAGAELPAKVRLYEQVMRAVYAAYLEGRPACSGLGLRTGRTIGIYNIATVPWARRRGLGAAVTQRIIDDGAASGCDVAVLQSSEMGRPIYERLGFRKVVDYVGYVDPASLGRAGANEGE